jgi:hypothetical protein
VYALAAVLESYVVWDPAVHGERRSGVSRRRTSIDGDRIAWFDDRRLGLGRRWSDWRRPRPAENADPASTPLHA